MKLLTNWCIFFLQICLSTFFQHTILLIHNFKKLIIPFISALKIQHLLGGVKKNFLRLKNTKNQKFESYHCDNSKFPTKAINFNNNYPITRTSHRTTTLQSPHNVILGISNNKIIVSAPWQSRHYRFSLHLSSNSTWYYLAHQLVRLVDHRDIYHSIQYPNSNIPCKYILPYNMKKIQFYIFFFHQHQKLLEYRVFASWQIIEIINK